MQALAANAASPAAEPERGNRSTAYRRTSKVSQSRRRACTRWHKIITVVRRWTFPCCAVHGACRRRRRTRREFRYLPYQAFHRSAAIVMRCRPRYGGSAVRAANMFFPATLQFAAVWSACRPGPAVKVQHIHCKTIISID